MAPAIKTPFEALTGWLQKYADLPGADRVFSLAKKRAPAGVELQPPLGVDGPAYVSARDAFYSGDTKAAHTLAIAAGNEHWIAGLAAFRMKNYAEARGHFHRVAFDGEEDDWVRAGAAYWAARSAMAEGRPEDGPGIPAPGRPRLADLLRHDRRAAAGAGGRRPGRSPALRPAAEAGRRSAELHRQGVLHGPA